MSNLFTQYLSHTLRPILLRLLKWTEQVGPMSAPRARLFFNRNIHVPTWLVTLGVWALLNVVLFLEIGPGFRPAVAVLIMSTSLVAMFVQYIHTDHPEMVDDEDAVTLLGVLVIGSVLAMELWFDAVQHFSWMSPYGFPLPMVGLLTAILLHPRLAVITTVALSLVFGVLSGFSLEAAVVACFAGMAGVNRCLRVRTRGDLTQAGLWVAVGGAAAVLMMGLMEDWPGGRILFAVKWVMVGSVLSTLLTLSLLPYLELYFSRLSNIRLLELSDVNHPLLKRLSLEAPGTFHHSLIMASLAQAAAERIGANALLCRVGAYFHDVGKIAKPEYFVENQGALGNPHELLPPNMSRIVIQSHVKDGMALAQQHNLEPAVANFITMHHGTSRIEYFYRRAIEQTTDENPVDEDLYRYPGPRPHTRETAIVMMADSVEASARSLDDPTHARLADHVERIVNSKMADGQFANVPLTLAEIEQIKESFVNTLVGVYHTRVKYPTSQETDQEYGPPASQRP